MVLVCVWDSQAMANATVRVGSGFLYQGAWATQCDMLLLVAHHEFDGVSSNNLTLLKGFYISSVCESSCKPLFYYELLHVK